ncbi:ankyrin repeat domain-containing protein [Pseudomonas aeruginosa]|uniref:ankyrin repeat domain-containing protein n=1 Tax=Pseudomonas aeruginosa TaxID=287 RepID=UPI001A2292F0|nr:ankyrin repeat domain-containing protein [Pseudomonas aeruginosa]MBG6734418.1 ankyrin repeat domain-containing protein [Pseudomonas aeruginosa]MBX5748991.1 ankyrin repeat domain-containing protein [Pseudomonas aeruginosa]MCT5440543.1 ankyrin repeat domain-containing protein [Pseudomonas aeruginosa]MCT5585093.1 ankyrin repeat domain-containing protein [Pseudomonas aeruginosa]MDI2407156.1 ankyrin repeat domain-containing protein [Pseudomonas aeruginosa]
MLVCAAFSGGVGASDAGALLEAARRGDTAQVASLLERKVEVDAPSADGSTPLLLATANDHLAVARQLIEAGAEGRLEILRLTLLHGADLKSTNRYGGTALIPACERGHVEVVKTLLQAGVDPNHVNKLGWTGLLEAILLSDGGPRHQEIVRLLIDAGADVNLADADSVSPLAHARQRGQGGIERLLLAAGAQ